VLYRSRRCVASARRCCRRRRTQQRAWPATQHHVCSAAREALATPGATTSDCTAPQRAWLESIASSRSADAPTDSGRRVCRAARGLGRPTARQDAAAGRRRAPRGFSSVLEHSANPLWAHRPLWAQP
jgi:hypothetical protein